MDALEALLNYEQADEDGVMVLVSRQAIHEIAAEIEQLRPAVDIAVMLLGRTGNALEDSEELASAFNDETGKLAPYKDVPMGAPTLGGTRAEYGEWFDAKLDIIRTRFFVQRATGLLAITDTKLKPGEIRRVKSIAIELKD